MKERIKELAEQSGLAIPADVRSGYIYPEGMMKFAELIVRECADYITDKASIETLLGKRLLEHFGVE
jgi:hypothetical protein